MEPIPVEVALKCSRRVMRRRDTRGGRAFQGF